MCTQVVVFNETNYKPKDFAELLNVSVKTLQRWDCDNILKAFRTPTHIRYYTYDQYLEFKGINNIGDEKKKVIIIVVNNETLTPNEELVQDIIFILHVLSYKIYGMIKYKKKIEEYEEIAKSI